MIKGLLFSEYFVNEGIKNTEDYQKLTPDIEQLYKEIHKLYSNFPKNTTPDEADTEDRLIRPILDKLGFHYSRQKSPSGKGRADVPDFILFANENNRKEFDNAPTNKKPWSKGICILEGKRWNRFLDKGDKTDPMDSHVPSNQILRYLSSAEIASNGKILWGILTNGKIWRLYYNRYPARSDGYIEIDLDEIFGSATLFTPKDLFKLFYLFFRKEAFIPADWRPDKTFLQFALEEGKKWEEKVSEDLKDKIFKEVFRNLSNGFVENAKEKYIEINEEFLKEVYENTLIFLYRLLFMFYAEDRNLLPVSNKAYRKYSLSEIRDEIAKKIDIGETLSETATTYWDKLKSLSKIINKGDRKLKMSPYNGGLFESENHKFLKQFSIADNFLIPAIDMLGRDYSEPLFKKRISYRTLSVRQLGSVYEGLLEFRLKIADTHLKTKKEKGKEFYEPTDIEKQATIKKGDLYLTNDKAERKATGSYYTPDYIVQYIVKNTIEPLISERITKFKHWRKEVAGMSKQKIIKKLREKQERIDPKTKDNRKFIDIYKTALLKTKDPVSTILNLKILDPAMGSGHFLVGTVDYISERVLEILAEISNETYFGKEKYESPVIKKLEDIRNKILEKANKENYSIDETKLEDKNLIKRIILKQCIYGVDINPLAVELTKVSLWLHTFTTGAPLSFLDHHLRCGNSLIGVWNVGDVIIPTADKYQDFLRAVNNMILIEEIQDLTINETEESAKLYDGFKQKLLPFTRRFDVSISAKYFMKENINTIKLLEQKAFNETYKFMLKMRKILTEKYNKVMEIADKKHFFHWKLEFPEIWFEQGKEKQNGGFDAVIGNPPYGAEFNINEKFLLENKFDTKTKDSSAYFIEQGTRLSKSFFGMIVPKSISFYAKWQSIRDYIFQKTFINYVADVGIAFKDAIYEQIILVLSKKSPNKTNIDIFGPLKSPVDKVLVLSRSVNLNFMVKNGIILFYPISEAEQKISSTILKNSVLIKNIQEQIFGNINLTDIKRALEKSEEELLKESFFAEPKPKSNFVPFIRRDPDIIRYLVKRWYLLEIPSNYRKIKEIMKPRVFIKPLRGKRLLSFYDMGGSFATHHHMISCVIKKGAGYSYPFIVSVVNSKVPSFFLEIGIFSRTTETAREMNKPYFERIPVPKIDFNQYNSSLLNKLKNEFNNSSFNKLKLLLPEQLNTKTIHDFLSFLAEEMVRMTQVKYFLELFIENKLDEGSEEKIQVLEELSKKRTPLPEDFLVQKEIARSLISKYTDKISKTDDAIDPIIYRLYGLDEPQCSVITQFFNKKPSQQKRRLKL